MYSSIFTPSYFDGRLGCFHILVIAGDAAGNRRVDYDF